VQKNEVVTNFDFNTKVPFDRTEVAHLEDGGEHGEDGDASGLVGRMYADIVGKYAEETHPIGVVQHTPVGLVGDKPSFGQHSLKTLTKHEGRLFQTVESFAETQ
jgi:hypothetical protein